MHQLSLLHSKEKKVEKSMKFGKKDRETLSTSSLIATRKGMPASCKIAYLPIGTVIAKPKDQLLAVLFSDRRHVKFLTTNESARLVCGFLKTNIYTYTSLFKLSFVVFFFYLYSSTKS